MQVEKDGCTKRSSPGRGETEEAEADSFRTDWLDLLAVQGTLKSLLKHHSSKASILQCSANAGDLGLIPGPGRSHDLDRTETDKA